MHGRREEEEEEREREAMGSHPSTSPYMKKNRRARQLQMPTRAQGQVVSSSGRTHMQVDGTRPADPEAQEIFRGRPSQLLAVLYVPSPLSFFCLSCLLSSSVRFCLLPRFELPDISLSISPPLSLCNYRLPLLWHSTAQQT